MDQPLGSVGPRLELARTDASGHPGLAALPDAGVRSFASDALMFTSATYAAQGLLFVAGVAQKRLLGPTATGYWALMTTFTVLFNVVPIGTVDGAGRQIPFHRGRGDRARAASLANTAASFGVLTNGLAGLTIAGIAIAFGSRWQPQMRYGLVLLGLIAPLAELADAHERLMQATKRFKVSSVLAIVRAAVALTLQTLFVWLFGFYGMFMGAVAVAVAALVVWNRLGLTSLRAPAFRWRIERTRLRELSRFGIPMMLQGQIWALFLVVDNLIVAAFIDVKHLGYYAVACSATTYVMLLPQGIGSALVPRMSESFGRTGDPASIGRYATDVQRLLAQMLVPVVVGAAFFLMPVLIRQALPQFTPAIPVVRIMVAASFVISLSTMPIKVLLATGHRWSVTGLTLLSLAINAIANYVAVGVLHGGLEGAAWAVAFSYFATFVVLTAFALTRTLPARRTIAHLGELIVVFAYTISALWAIEVVLGAGGGDPIHDVGIGAAKMAVLLVALAPLFALAEARFQGLTAVASLLRGATHKLARRRDA
jgi:O-antigen/teichoic acid export membrane protein